MEGKIVCRRRDRFGEIVVSDSGQRRSLYFGDGALQSCMLINRPAFLVMDYSQAMMCALLFCRQPRRVLLVGLGGGSLVKFLFETCPGVKLTVAEISDTVTTVAHDFFSLPRDHPNLRIINRSGQDAVAGLADSCEPYDLVLIDAFDDAGPAAGLLAPDFLARCKNILAADGVFACNLWNRPEDNFTGNHAAIARIFTGRTLRLLLAESYKNAIVFGFHRPFNNADLPRLRPRAKSLGSETGINFFRYLRQLGFQNFA